MFAYRWRLQREMRGEIRAIMREYMPLPAGASEAAAEAHEPLLPASGGGGGSKERRGGGGGDVEHGGGSPEALPHTPVGRVRWGGARMDP